jgi:hypothetical protein
MGLDDKVQDAKDAVKHGVDDTKDAIDEAAHRTAADAEKARRDTAGDMMTPGEKAGSVIRETTDRVKADVDEAKRKVRDRTS